MANANDVLDGASRVVCLTAPNPSPLTLEGTNSYLVLGDGEALVIDPGPADEAHVEAIAKLALANACPVRAIAVTHGHPDHAPGAALLGALTRAPIYAHPAASFPFDRALPDGAEIAIGGAALRAMHAPGHARDHLVFWFAAEATLFTGDVIIGRGTVVIAPPDGDMRAYQATLRRLRDGFAHIRTIFGGHGEPVRMPAAKIEEYIRHREARERQLVAAIAKEERTIPELVTDLYRDVSPALWPAAARQLLAYLIALEREGRIRVRTLARAPREHEREILNPDLSHTGDAAGAAVVLAELGFESGLSGIEAYALLPD